MEAGKRLFGAVVLSSLCVVPLYFALIIVSGDLNTSSVVPTLMMALIFAFIGVLLVGLPMHIFLMWRQLPRPIHYAIPGFIAPALLVVVAHPFGADGALWISWQALLMGAFGAIVALVFRHIALHKKTLS